MRHKDTFPDREFVPLDVEAKARERVLVANGPNYAVAHWQPRKEHPDGGVWFLMGRSESHNPQERLEFEPREYAK